VSFLFPPLASCRHRRRENLKRMQPSFPSRAAKQRIVGLSAITDRLPPNPSICSALRMTKRPRLFSQSSGTFVRAVLPQGTARSWRSPMAPVQESALASTNSGTALGDAATELLVSSECGGMAWRCCNSLAPECHPGTLGRANHVDRSMGKRQAVGGHSP
jgi:hypothetical protein